MTDPQTPIYSRQEGRGTFTVFGQKPPPGDALCMAMTGSTEQELVQRILAGEFDIIIKNRNQRKKSGG